MAHILSREMVVGACTIYSLEGKHRDGQDILLVHGAKFQAATWQELGTLDRLHDAGFAPQAIDLPGFGKSPKCAVPPEKVLQAFIAEQKLSRPVLVGPSMGGRICLDVALNHPESVGGLVLIGAVGVGQREDRLDTIQVPCLILWGSNDAIAPLASAHLLQERIVGAELRIFDGAGHPCYLDQPDLWHEELLAFLKRHFT
ncbi:MAG: alpha/beta hydrolase [Thermodesulfobacteriota bacterium]|nr:alpha/beta hydrolase [Thermodesulfobacteriota bacterium]